MKLEFLKEYLLAVLPKQLQRSQIKAQFQFLKFFTAVYTEFLGFFHSDPPLGQIRQDKLSELLKKFIKRVMKTDPSC